MLLIPEYAYCPRAFSIYKPDQWFNANTDDLIAPALMIMFQGFPNGIILLFHLGWFRQSHKIQWQSTFNKEMGKYRMARVFQFELLVWHGLSRIALFHQVNARDSPNY